MRHSYGVLNVILLGAGTYIGLEIVAAVHLIGTVVEVRDHYLELHPGYDKLRFSWIHMIGKTAELNVEHKHNLTIYTLAGTTYSRYVINEPTCKYCNLTCSLENKLNTIYVALSSLS